MVGKEMSSIQQRDLEIFLNGDWAIGKEKVPRGQAGLVVPRNSYLEQQCQAGSDFTQAFS